MGSFGRDIAAARSHCYIFPEEWLEECEKSGLLTQTSLQIIDIVQNCRGASVDKTGFCKRSHIGNMPGKKRVERISPSRSNDDDDGPMTYMYVASAEVIAS